MAAEKHILVVEDERHLAMGIKFNLEKEGYRVTIAASGVEALRIVDEQEAEVDLIILDIMLPGMSGYAVCEALRQRGSDVPILILSARTLAEDRTRGFDVGANQYLTKPFDLDELLSRVRNLLTHYPRRFQAARPLPTRLAQYAFGDARIDFEQCEVQVRGQSVTLTKREWELLAYFVENEGRLIPRHELLEQVWRMPGHIQTRAPDQFLVRLRKVFEKDPANPQHFLTIRDMGYRFVAHPPEELPASQPDEA
jgi:DNA-binding response OmpR family regulator